MPDMLHIWAYDISDDRRRQRVARLLEDHGARVQHSVFEIVQTKAEAGRLAEAVERELLPGDRLRIYPLSMGDVGIIHCYGGAPVQEGSDWWLL